MQKAEDIKMTSANQIQEMLQVAISHLEPISFEVDGLSASYLPQIADLPLCELEPSGFLSLSHYGIPTIIFEETDHPQRLTVPVDFSSQDDVNFSLNVLWEEEAKDFFGTAKNLKKTAWTQGNEYHEQLEKMTQNPYMTVSWTELCAFSQTFTNGIAKNLQTFDPYYVYLDNSGGFKARGAWINQYDLESVSDNIVFDLRTFKPVPGESIFHAFGAWNAYAPCDGAIFFFESCNGNQLLALVDELEVDHPDAEYEVRVYFSNQDCNYSRYFGVGRVAEIE